ADRGGRLGRRHPSLAWGPMASVGTRLEHPQWLDAQSRDRLARRLEDALRRARRNGAEVIASVTARAPGEPDPTATVVASRRPSEDWFCLEQPDRHGSAVAALGDAWSIEATGSERFARASAQWKSIVMRAAADPPLGAPGSGLAAFGGFAFAADAGGGGPWRGYQPASLRIPALSLVRRDSEVFLTINVRVAADDMVEQLLVGVDQ